MKSTMRNESDDDRAPSMERAFWSPPLPPPSESVVKDETCQGILSRTLHNALLKVQEKNNSMPNEGGMADDEGATEDGKDPATEPNNHPIIEIIDDAFVSSVMSSFGQAIADGQTKQYEDMVNEESTPKMPPPAILHGRVESYNRKGGKWKIVLKDAKFRPRQPLPQHRPKQRRKRKSLWWYTENDNTASEKGDEISCSDLEILAYNDNDA